MDRSARYFLEEVNGCSWGGTRPTLARVGTSWRELRILPISVIRRQVRRCTQLNFRTHCPIHEPFDGFATRVMFCPQDPLDLVRKRNWRPFFHEFTA